MGPEPAAAAPNSCCVFSWFITTAGAGAWKVQFRSGPMVTCETEPPGRSRSVNSAEKRNPASSGSRRKPPQRQHERQKYQRAQEEPQRIGQFAILLAHTIRFAQVGPAAVTEADKPGYSGGLPLVRLAPWNGRPPAWKTISPGFGVFRQGQNERSGIKGEKEPEALDGDAGQVVY